MARWTQAVAVALVVCASSCGTAEDEPATPELVDPSGARFLEDGTAPGPMISWMPISDVDSVLRGVDDIVVATLVGTERAVHTLGPDAEDPGGGQTEYDGLVVRVDEVLAGRLTPGDETTIAIPIATVRDGVTDRWVSSEHLDFVAPAVRTLVEAGQTTRYLLFTVNRGGTKQVYGRIGIVELSETDGFARTIFGSEFSAAAPNRFEPPADGWSVDAIRDALG